MKKYKISPDVKEQIIARVKEGTVSIKEAASEHGISDTTIYNWLGKKVEGAPSILEYAKLKRENDELLKLVGLMTLKLSEAQKKK